MKLRQLAIGLAVATSAMAQPTFPVVNSTTPLALDSLIAIGFANNPALRQNQMDTRLNRIGKINAVGNFLPKVSLGMTFGETHYRNPTYQNPDGSVSTYPITYEVENIVWDAAGIAHRETKTVTVDVPEGSSRSSSQYLSLSEELFDGGRRIFLYRMAKAQEQMNNLTVENAQKLLAQSIAQQVMLVLTQSKLLDLNNKLRDQKKDAYDLAKARFDVGAVTELDVLQAEIELGTSQNVIREQERNFQAAREALNQLLGIDLRSSFPLAENSEVTPYKFEIDKLVEDAYRNRTDLRIAGLTVTRAQHNLWMAKTAYLPTIDFGLQWTRSEQAGIDESWTLSPRNHNTSYNMSLRWNLFDGFSREYDVVTQRVARDKAKENERELQLSLEKQVRDAYYNLEKVFNQLTTTARNRDLAERTLNLERERYRLGATSQLGLRDAQVTYARAETENLSKILEYQSSLIALELAVGKSLR
jgi:outer membrane protein